MSLFFIKAFYCNIPNSCALILLKTNAASVVLPNDTCPGASLEKEPMSSYILFSNFLHAQHEVQFLVFLILSVLSLFSYTNICAILF